MGFGFLRGRLGVSFRRRGEGGDDCGSGGHGVVHICMSIRS